MAHGVFAGDPASLSIQAAFPKMVALEAAAGSIVKAGLQKRKERPAGIPRATVHVAPDGMAGVAARLAAYLGEGFRPNNPVRAVRRGDDGRWQVAWDGGTESANTVVVALAPAQAAPLVPQPLSDLLTDRPLAAVAVVGLGGPTDSFRLPTGFGALAGPDSGIRALGILFESEYAPGRAPSGFQLAKGIYGGAADPGIMGRSDEGSRLPDVGRAGPHHRPDRRSHLGAGAAVLHPAVPDRPRRLDGPRRRAAGAPPRPARGRMGIPGHRGIQPRGRCGPYRRRPRPGARLVTVRTAGRLLIAAGVAAMVGLTGHNAKRSTI